MLLTGASGFLGVHTMQRLLGDGHRIRALVRSPARLQANLLPLGVDLEDSHVEVAEGDMTSTSTVRTAVARELQEAGAPVTIVNPGGILGPHDPDLGENNEVMAHAQTPGYLTGWRFLPGAVEGVRTVACANTAVAR